MTREDAAAVLKDSKQQNEIMRDNPSTFWAPPQMADGIKNAEKRITALNLAISALRAPTREQVERMRGEWRLVPNGVGGKQYMCSKCGGAEYEYWRRHFAHGNENFCSHCGSPMTDEAVDILWRRWKEAADGEAEAD